MIKILKEILSILLVGLKSNNPGGIKVTRKEISLEEERKKRKKLLDKIEREKIERRNLQKETERESAEAYRKIEAKENIRKASIKIPLKEGILKRIFSRKKKPITPKPAKPSEPKPTKPSEPKPTKSSEPKPSRPSKGFTGFGKIWPFIKFILIPLLVFAVVSRLGLNLVLTLIITVVASIIFYSIYGIFSGQGYFGEGLWKKIGEKIAEQGLISYSFGLIIKLLFLGVIGIIIYSIFLTSVGREYLERATSVDVGNVWNKLWINVIHAKERVVEQATGVGDWTNPYVTETEEKKGVDIRKIILQPSYFPETTAEIGTVGFVRSLEEPTEVSFSCSLNDAPGKILKEKETISVQPNFQRPFGVGCTVEIGDLIDNKDPTHKKFKFNAAYTNYVNKPELKLWVLSGEERRKLMEGINPIDPFDKYREVFEAQRFDKLLQLDNDFRTTKSSSRYGPLKVSMTVFEPQPLSEGTYKLFVEIKNDKLRWDGKIKSEKNKLNLKFSSGVEPGDCEEIEFGSEDLHTQTCNFHISNIEPDLSVVSIEGVVIYDYEFTKEATILVSGQGVSAETEKKPEA